MSIRVVPEPSTNLKTFLSLLINVGSWFAVVPATKNNFWLS